MSMQQIEELMEDFNRRFEALQLEFEVKAAAIAWGIAADILKDSTSATLPLKRNGRKKLNYPAIKGVNKRQRFAALLETRKGKWARRDSDNVYICEGPATTADHFLMRKEGEGSKTIAVSLISLLSKWNHIP